MNIESAFHLQKKESDLSVVTLQVKPGASVFTNGCTAYLQYCLHLTLNTECNIFR